MDFKPALWDGSDPSYAPGLSWSGDYPFWRAPRRYVKAGYAFKQARLDGVRGDVNDEARAMRCRELTREMLRWWDGTAEPVVQPGTWHWAISHYRSDDISPYRDVKANTRDSYDWQLARWDEAIGKMMFRDTDYARIMEWKLAMQRNGRSVSYIRRMFTMLRTVARYGALIGDVDAGKASMILSSMRVKTPAPRNVAPTRDQIMAVVEQADLAGSRMFALGILLQWWFALRAVDVRGHWLKSDTNSGITRGNTRWQDGITWDMIDRDVSTLSKQISKTREHLKEEMTFDLTAVPEIRERLLEISERVGPVIVSERNGLPYTTTGWSHAFRRFARAAGIPDEVWMMDVRAGAITEAGAMGASPYAMRDAAGHSQISTTDRYARGRNDSIAKVVRLRKNNDQTP